MNAGNVLLRWIFIGICSTAIGLSGACKPSTGKNSTGPNKDTSQKKSGGGDKGGEKKSEGKKSGGKQGGGGKKGGQKKSGGKKSGSKKSGGKKGGGKSAGDGADAKSSTKGTGESTSEKPQKQRDPGSKGKRAGKSSGTSSAGSSANTLEGIAFSVPANWKESKAENVVPALRGCYEIPAAAGAEGKAIVLIHQQPEVKGKSKETLTKLLSKVKPAADAKVQTPTITEETSSDGIKMTIGDMTGMMTSREGAADVGKATEVRIIAAVIEDPKGPHTVRVTGPKAVVDGAADSVLSFLRSVKSKT